jgi:hypothetical protein
MTLAASVTLNYSPGLFLKYEMGNSPTSNMKVLNSNPGHVTGYPDQGATWLSQYLPTNSGTK